MITVWNVTLAALLLSTGCQGQESDSGATPSAIRERVISARTVASGGDTADPSLRPSLDPVNGYLCVPDQAAGFVWKGESDKWVATPLTTDEKYLVKKEGAHWAATILGHVEPFFPRCDEYGPVFTDAVGIAGEARALMSERKAAKLSAAAASGEI